MTVTPEALMASNPSLTRSEAEHAANVMNGRPQPNPNGGPPKAAPIKKSQVALAIDLLVRQGVDPNEATQTVIQTGDLSIIQGQIDAERARQQEEADEQARQDWLTYDPAGIEFQIAEHRRAKEERTARLALADERAEMLGIPDPELLTEDERLALLDPPDPAQADTLENNLRVLAEIDAAREGGEG